MRHNYAFQEHTLLLKMLLRWSFLGSLIGIAAGASSALFLHSLDWATATRQSCPVLLFFLPVAGICIAFLYDRFGKSVASGNNLLLDSIHSEQETAHAIPLRMAPLVLIGTVITHLFGGSAGREGTAVQMGGSLAAQLTQLLKLTHRDHRLIVMSGVSGGFGSVFGTPLSGAIFGLEVLSIGAIRYEALIPCFVASYVGDVTCRALGVTHSFYGQNIPHLDITLTVWIAIIILGILAAGSAFLFTELTEAISALSKKMRIPPLAKPALGGVLIILMTVALRTDDYLGLSLPLIERSFHPGEIVWPAFLLKILFTAITLGTGFKGGEVTPLFCIGATLGSIVGRVYGGADTYFAALGFVAVFAGAANTPLACAIMGIELFGSHLGVPLTAVCILSYILSGHRGIYVSQRIAVPKGHGIEIGEGTRIKDL